jgi:central kinetochore subunit Mis15/CHL4
MPISIPTTSALPPSQLISATHPTVTKTLQRLSRPSLLGLALDWLDEKNQEITAPYLRRPDEDPDEQDIYPACASLAELREIYSDLQARKGSKRDVVDRIIEGDWRDGISLYQLAMADMQYLYDHPTSQKWSALKITPLSPSTSSAKPPAIPRFHPSTFLQNLQREVLPDVKAHYNLDRHTRLPLWILRIYIIDSPYNTALALSAVGSRSKSLSFDASKTFYVAFPDAAPYIYVSITTTTSAPSQQGASSANRSLRKLTLEGIPKAFSRPRERYKLESTALSARNLDALCERRGGGRTNAAGGGWGVYAEEDRRDHPLHAVGYLRTPESPVVEEEEEERQGGEGMKRKREEDPSVVKRRKLVAQGRFGNSARRDDGKGIERLDIRLEDAFPAGGHLFAEIEEAPRDGREKKKKGRRSAVDVALERDDEEGDEGWRPDVRVTFQGQHIFAGIRELVEAGVVDGERMPGWMTGEEGVSIGVVRDGRIKGGRGSGV